MDTHKYQQFIRGCRDKIAGWIVDPKQVELFAYDLKKQTTLAIDTKLSGKITRLTSKRKNNNSGSILKRPLVKPIGENTTNGRKRSKPTMMVCHQRIMGNHQTMILSSRNLALLVL